MVCLKWGLRGMLHAFLGHVVGMVLRHRHGELHDFYNTCEFCLRYMHGELHDFLWLVWNEVYVTCIVICIVFMGSMEKVYVVCIVDALNFMTRVKWILRYKHSGFMWLRYTKDIACKMDFTLYINSGLYILWHVLNWVLRYTNS